LANPFNFNRMRPVQPCMQPLRVKPVGKGDETPETEELWVLGKSAVKCLKGSR
jgi:hypothetical protein